MSSPTEIAWERIRAMKPVVLEHRDEADRIRRLPDPLAQAFLDADIYRLMVPTDLGGLGLDPITTFDLIEEVSTYDGSVGWNMTIGVNTAVMCGGLPVERMRSHFATPHCGTATSGKPGRAIPVEGGYLLSGHWTFASGIHQAKLVVGFGMVMDGDSPRQKASGGPDARMFMLAPEKVTILDAWHTSGMRGTGSTDWEVTDMFVPEEDTAYVFTEKSEHPGPIFRVPATFFGLGLSGVSLGVARCAIEGLQAMAADSPPAFRERGFAQYAAGKAIALHESACMFIRESFGRIWANVLEGRPHTIEQKARCRAAYVHGAESALAAVDLCTQAAGGAGVYEDLPFARAARDVRAMQAHAMLGRKMIEVAGKAFLGGGPDPFL